MKTLFTILALAVAATAARAQFYIYGTPGAGNSTNPVAFLEVAGSGVASSTFTNIAGKRWWKLSLAGGGGGGDTTLIASNGLGVIELDESNLVVFATSVIVQNGDSGRALSNLTLNGVTTLKGRVVQNGSGNTTNTFASGAVNDFSGGRIFGVADAAGDLDSEAVNVGYLNGALAGYAPNALFAGAGTTGVVTSASADAGKFLKADGSWDQPTISAAGVLSNATVYLWREATGDFATFKASADTDAARGIALSNAFAAAVAGDAITVGPGDYEVSSTLNIVDRMRLDFRGAVIYNHTVGGADLMLASNVHDFVIMGGKLRGSVGAQTGGSFTSKSGLRVKGTCNSSSIDGLIVQNMEGVGVAYEGVSGFPGGSYSGLRVTGLQVGGCTFGAYLPSGSEYSAWVNCQISANVTGMYVAAGNTKVVGCNLNQNHTGIVIKSGGNSGHGMVAACNINHNTAYGVIADGETLGMSFIGCHLFGQSGQTATILLKSCVGISFIDGQIGTPSSIVLDGTLPGYNFLRDVWFVNADPTVSIAATGSQANRGKLRIENCISQSGGPSTLNDAFFVGVGGTGTTNTPPVGAGLFGHTNGAYIAQPVVSVGAVKQVTLSNSIDGAKILTGNGDNVGLIVQAVSNSLTQAADPSSITNGMLAWYKPETLTNTVDASSINEWPDSSGNGRNATNEFASGPTWEASELNGYPVARFSGTKWLETGSFSGTAPFTTYVVMKATTLGNYAAFRIANGASGLLLYNTTGGTNIIANAGSDARIYFNVSAWSIVDQTWTNTASTAVVNDLASQSISPGNQNLNGSLRIGNHHSGGTSYAWRGEIAELIVFQGVLNAGQREGVRRYLAKKYLLPVAQGASLGGGQTANLVELRNSAGTLTGGFNANGNLRVESFNITNGYTGAGSVLHTDDAGTNWYWKVPSL